MVQTAQGSGWRTMRRAEHGQADQKCEQAPRGRMNGGWGTLSSLTCHHTAVRDRPWERAAECASVMSGGGRFATTSSRVERLLSQATPECRESPDPRRRPTRQGDRTRVTLTRHGTRTARATARVRSVTTHTRHSETRGRGQQTARRVQLYATP
eukprot:7379097-Prymnesium_polylepis.1